ncbi:haloacid dehalogenase superfamily, subfamily IA, variant 4 [Bellilinea caldifistulae]|uniref:HAD family hydrolase n=1 Tax=Bellilinea caldifistulae TaxID=360411 RepID=UPI0007858170|nr:HAD family phosphatase [Bellilinea caldifistulae]GAP10326.1 haloacid dehalogenase superfamily, subfamily IA, variant 4 [Bellilinea caldifistulae]
MVEAVIRAVIFDMGGVILRTEDPSPRERLAHSLGMTRRALEEAVFMSPSSRLAEVGEISEAEHWRIVLDQLGVREEERLAFREAFWSGDRVDYQLVEWLRNLRPSYKTGLLSNAWDEARNAVQSRFGFLDAFDVSLFSAEVKLRKPDERFYRLILERLGAKPEESVFVDDFPPNIEAASKLGMQAVHFRDPQQALKEVRDLLNHQTGQVYR